MNDETKETDAIQVPVLIVGGALVGLSMSLFLSWWGVPSLLVEKHPEPARLPRARGFNARTMELFRMLGLEKTIRANQSPTEYQGMVRVESLVGRELMRLSDADSAHLAAITPTTGCMIGQDKLEPILAEAAREKPESNVRFNTEMLSFSQDAKGVSAIIRDRATGREQRVEASYLIAADGSRSGIRDTLGIQTQGPGTISYMTDVAFEADLREALGGRHFYLYYVSNPGLPDGQGGLMPLDKKLRWSFGTAIHPERGERREDMTDERCIEQIRIATGIPDLEVKILPAYPWDSVKVGVWEQAARYAERYREGRVFLAGDAAHTVLPTGGLGANTGIQDAFNLAWKLALVHAGKASDTLLDTYEAERLPIGKLTVEQTLQRYYYRTGTAESALIDMYELAFGYRYHSAAISAEPGADNTAITQDPRTTRGEPGTRIPLLTLERQGERTTTIDLCIGRWSLLTGAQGNEWSETARRLDLPLAVYTVGGEGCEWQDVENRFTSAYGISERGAILVRPDGFVAWRSHDLVSDPQEMLAEVLTA